MAYQVYSFPGRFGACPGSEDSSKEEDDSSLDMCKEDEAHASKFFFSSPMSAKVLDDGLVLYSSHAQNILQGEATGAAVALVGGLRMFMMSPPLCPWW